MYFQWLQARLIGEIRARVRSGELTERKLALMTGVSQPHIHNVLKGARVLSVDVADTVMRRLGISILDLLEETDVRRGTGLGYRDPVRYVELPVLEGQLGPGYPFPAAESKTEKYPFLFAEVALLELPVAARLAEDPAMRPRFYAGDLVLLDRGESRRRLADDASYYAVEHLQAGLIRRIRRGRRGLYLISESGGGDYISLRDQNILEIVKARVAWYGHYMEPLAPKPTQETG